MRQFFSEHPMLFLIGATIWLLFFMWIAVKFRKKYQGLKLAESFIKENEQFKPLDQKALNEAIGLSKKHGKEKEFLELLANIRKKYGYDGVKVGHLFWIWFVLEGNIKDPKNIPNFANPKAEKGNKK
jgi:hypothetical protein